MQISLRTLKNRLRQCGISRRLHPTPMERVRECITEQLQNSAGSVGYRAMHRILTSRYNLHVSSQTVMTSLLQLDPTGCATRRSRRFSRRIYYCKGPNDTWHTDGWDKLKPFGISVHGCIDGFSRRVMWLVACSSNKDPATIARFYLDCIEDVGCFPRQLWSDAGTENVAVAAMQSQLAQSPQSHRYVTSVRNQRVESWWSFFIKSRGHWWRDFLGDLCACIWSLQPRKMLPAELSAVLLHGCNPC